MNNKTIDQYEDQVTPQVGSPMEDSTEYVEHLQKELGLLSDRISLGMETNIAFLRCNYGVFTGYLRGIYGVNTEEMRKKYGRSSEKRQFTPSS